MNKVFVYAVIAYIFVGIVTFGPAYVSASDACEDARNPAECQSAEATIRTMFWPLYWSVHFASDE